MAINVVAKYAISMYEERLKENPIVAFGSLIIRRSIFG